MTDFVNTTPANNSILQPTVLYSSSKDTGKRKMEESLVLIDKKPRNTLVQDFKNKIGEGTSKKV